MLPSRRARRKAPAPEPLRGDRAAADPETLMSSRSRELCTVTGGPLHAPGPYYGAGGRPATPGLGAPTGRLSIQTRRPAGCMISSYSGTGGHSLASEPGRAPICKYVYVLHA